MTVPDFDYEFWRHRVPTAWETRELHWHAYLWRGNAKALESNADRRSAEASVPPFVVREWLLKDPGNIVVAPRSPEEAVEWLRAEFTKCVPEIGQQATRVPQEIRFGMALYHLRCGKDISWGFWVGTNTFVSMAAIGIAKTECKVHRSTKAATESDGRPGS